jgi:hypothetical protein
MAAGPMIVLIVGQFFARPVSQSGIYLTPREFPVGDGIARGNEWTRGSAILIRELIAAKSNWAVVHRKLMRA